MLIVIDFSLWSSFISGEGTGVWDVLKWKGFFYLQGDMSEQWVHILCWWSFQLWRFCPLGIVLNHPNNATAWAMPKYGQIQCIYSILILVYWPPDNNSRDFALHPSRFTISNLWLVTVTLFRETRKHISDLSCCQGKSCFPQKEHCLPLCHRDSVFQ